MTLADYLTLWLILGLLYILAGGATLFWLGWLIGRASIPKED